MVGPTVRSGEGRRTHEALLGDKSAIERILKQGAVTARSIAEPMLTKDRRKIGIDRLMEGYSWETMWPKN
ncbi:MAG: hypothetical protein JRC88_11270 [Deltaproteobacteria bacterium]|nr:hypothetical protein [Deltaproteobacteria bacterium]